MVDQKKTEEKALEKDRIYIAISDCLTQLLQETKKPEEQQRKDIIEQQCNLLGVLILEVEGVFFTDKKQKLISQSCYGNVYDTALAGTVEAFVKEYQNKALTAEDEATKVAVGKKFLADFRYKKNASLKMQQKYERNEGMFNRLKKQSADKIVVELLKKYNLKISGRPGGDQDKDDGLDIDKVRTFLEKRMLTEEISIEERENRQKDIEQALKQISRIKVSSDLTVAQDKDGEESEYSKIDNAVEAEETLIKKDAEQFIQKTKQF